MRVDFYFPMRGSRRAAYAAKSLQWGVKLLLKHLIKAAIILACSLYD